jgi:diguanylate cyclase (GGDEF)-like protein
LLPHQKSKNGCTGIAEPFQLLTGSLQAERIVTGTPAMSLWVRVIRSVVVPGGIILSAAAVLIRFSWLPFSPSGLVFFYYAAFTAALILSLRFGSFRIVFCSVVLLLGHYALAVTGPSFHHGAGRAAFDEVALLVPLDFILLTFIPERALERKHLSRVAAVLFFESTFVYIFSRPDPPEVALLHFSVVHHYHLRLPQPAMLVFAAALALLAVRLVRFHRPADQGMFWSLLAVCMGLETGAVSRAGTAYFAAAGLILAGCIVESSYSLAYRDELTGLNSRRAFNDALLRLRPPYAVATVDIDHFKSINDTYGHDTGDQVLRLVASRLAGVSGGGQPYRVGGEEFTILFPGRNAKEIFDHLERLRMNIESCSFRLRKGEDRRKTPRDSDRRATSGRKARPTMQEGSGALSVTVSIGIAESSGDPRVERVLEQADKALYSAKQSGRNRIEMAASEVRGKKRKKTIKPTQL